MLNLEREELSRRASSMSKEERMVVLNSFPVEDLIEAIYLKYEDMKNKYESIQNIVNHETSIIGG